MIFWLLAIFHFLSHPGLAVDEFSLSAEINYRLGRDGRAAVRHQYHLTNNISQIYAREFRITLNSLQPENITAHDPGGSIIDSIDRSAEDTIIQLKFPNPVVGKNQTNNFVVEYNLNSLAVRKGKTWEIIVPGEVNNYSGTRYRLNIEIPTEFGQLSFSSAPITTNHQVGDKYQIQIDSSDRRKNIFLIFGEHQLLDFKLNYFIQNTTSETVDSFIPLPPDTNNQTIIFKSINPPPTRITIDPDGNWLAQYTLSPHQNLDIITEGQAKIHPNLGSRNSPILPDYTSAQTYWPVDNSQISTLAANLKTPRKIYDYVISTLSYDFSSIDTASRQGALTALNQPSMALCTEFTDLFVSLARAAGIPAREIEGFALSNNDRIKPTNLDSDILHAWPEYYDSTSSTWRQIDPTWEKTTNGINYFTDLDLGHLAFVIHGIDSRQPPPPGAYQPENYSKSVFVNLAQEEITTTTLPIDIKISQHQLIISNPNLMALYNLKISSPSSDFVHQMATMAPLSKIQVPFDGPAFFRSALPSHRFLEFNIISDQSPEAVTLKIVNPEQLLNQSILIGSLIFLLSIGGIIITSRR